MSSTAPPPESTLAPALHRAARDAGAGWAKWWCERLRREGRTVAGGFPGTLPEARSRVLQQLAAESAAAAADAMSPAELDVLARAAYVEAKNVWRASAVPDDGY